MSELCSVHVDIKKNAYKILVRKPDGKRLYGTHRTRQKDNIKADLKEIGCGLDSTAS
jgi:hypothetical protein